MEIIAAIIGAAVATLLTLVASHYYDAFKCDLKSHEDYLACLRGLIGECQHLLNVVAEVTPLYQQANGIVTKRLSADYLGAAKLTCIQHPRSTKLFPSLTVAHRDTLHTNDMMVRCEQLQLAGVNVDGIRAATISSLGGVKASVENLIAVSNSQYEIEECHRPSLFCKRCCAPSKPCYNS